MEGILLVFEGAISPVQEQQRPTGAHHDQILQAIVGEISKQRARGGIQNTDAGLLGHILEAAVPSIAVEPVWETGWLTDVEIIKAISIEITCRDSIVAVHVNPRRTVQNSSPVIGSSA